MWDTIINKKTNNNINYAKLNWKEMGKYDLINAMDTYTGKVEFFFSFFPSYLGTSYLLFFYRKLEHTECIVEKKWFKESIGKSI